MVNIEIIYAPLQRAVIHIRLRLPINTTLAEALHASGLFEKAPETKSLPVGIFSKCVSTNTILQEGDRIEVYRPLQIDPKEKRRLRSQ